MKNIIRNFILSITAINLVACESFLDIDAPLQEITAYEVFDSEQTAESAVIGLYSRMTSINNYAMNGFLSIYMGLASDEIWNTAANATFDVFKNNAILPTTSVISGSAWSPSYYYLYHANAVMEGLQNSNGISVEIKRSLEGEMYFSRALVNFYLVNLFGGSACFNHRLPTEPFEGYRRDGRNIPADHH